MDKFCGKCGSEIDPQTGLCPICDVKEVETDLSQNLQSKSDLFCGLCGSKIDEKTGLCLNCNKDLIKNNVIENRTSNEQIKNPDIKKSSGSKALIVLLTICLFLTSFFAIIVFEVRNTLENNADGMLDNLSLSNMIDATNSRSSSLDEFYDYMFERYEVSIDDEKLNEFIEASTIKEFLMDELEDFSEDLFDGNASLKVSKDTVRELIASNSVEYTEAFGDVLDSEKINAITNWICKDDEVVILRASNLKKDIPALDLVLTVGCSYVTIGIFFGISILIFLFMIKLNISKAFLSVGFLSFIFGLIGCLIAVISSLVNPFWIILSGGGFVGQLIGNFVTANVLVNVALVVFGVALLAIRKFKLNRA